MKSKYPLLLLPAVIALFFSSCNPKPAPLTTSTGMSLQDTVLPKTLFKLVREGSSNYLAYYFINSLKVDTTQNPPLLTLAAQSAAYDATNTSSVVHNGTSTSQVSSTISLNTDTVNAVCAGPFDVVNGRIYSYKGYLHYVYPKAAGSADSCICPVASIVYYSQNSSGGPMLIGFVVQNDLHSPAPPSHQ